MTLSIYASIGQMKQTRYNSVISRLFMKRMEIEEAEKALEEIELELSDLKDAFPEKKKAIYDEYFGKNVHRDAFEKIGYKIMVLEHEISAYKLKIKTQEENIDVLKQECQVIEQTKRELAVVLEKYAILVEKDELEQKKIAEYKDDLELEEFAKPLKN